MRQTPFVRCLRLCENPTRSRNGYGADWRGVPFARIIPINAMNEAIPVRKRRRRLQLSIREVLLAVVVIGLGIALYLERARSSALQEIVDGFPRPHLWIHAASPLEESWSARANISFTGELYPKDHKFSESTIVNASLYDPSSGAVLANTANPLTRSERGYGFYFTLNHGKNLPPGLYPIVIEVLDGETAIANATTVVQLVDTSRRK